MKIYWRRLQLSFDILKIDIWSLVTVLINKIGKQTVTNSVFWALEPMFFTKNIFLWNIMIENLLKKTPAFIWHIKNWYLITDAFRNDQICKQIVTISVILALQALFVAEKSFVVNQNHWKFIEEDSSFHLTYQTLISDD